jgi:methionyl-tRNA synthetase
MQALRQLLVTSALPYANGDLHLGHMVGYIQADIWVRLHKMLGHQCLYICGSDSHGTPIMIQAEKMGISSEALIQHTKEKHEQDFIDFGIQFDNYHTTHSTENKILVERIFKAHLAAGNISKRSITQLFDPLKQMFLPDRYIKGECPKCRAKDQYGDNCEICGTTYAPTDLKNPYSTLSGSTPIEKQSEHYFFKLQHYENFLKEWVNKGHLQPEVRNKLAEWLKEGLKEWDISRDAPYFGFTIPGEKDKYFYVWLDAPVGYMASLKQLCDTRKDLDFDTYFGKKSTVELYHFIGKDIIYFHALFWPALLHGAEFRTPTAIFANGFLTVNGQKMSKSRGTFIRARTYLDHLAPEYLRYYFAAKLSDKAEDLDINFDDFMQRINADLVGKFINIPSRTAPFLTKYFSGKLSAHCEEPTLLKTFQIAGDQIAKYFEKLNYGHAIREIMMLADRANQYIDEKKPWLLIKDENKLQEVQEVCSVGINMFRLLMIYLKPVLPYTAAQAEYFLNISPLDWQDKETLLVNHTIREFKPLIQRIDPKQLEAIKMAAQQDITDSIPATIKKTEQGKISIDEFSKIDLRIAKILNAEAVEGADKLLRLQVDMGSGETRQIFAGIKAAYAPETLINRHVLIVANLAPRKMRFGISEGMVLAAGDGGENVWLLSPDAGALAGMKVK